MEYTPIVTESLFSGVRADVLSGATGWIAVVLVVAGVGLIIRAITR